MSSELPMSEAQLQQTIVDALDLFGWLSFHDTDSRRNRAGFPDICAVHPVTGALFFAELKTAKGRLRPEQAQWRDALWVHGHKFYLWRPTDLDFALTFIQELSDPDRQ